MNSPKNLHIQAWRPGICSAFPLVPFKDYVEKAFFPLCLALGFSEYPPQPLWNTPTIMRTAQDQSLLTLKGVANV